MSVDGKALNYLAGRLLRLPVGYFQVRRTADIQRRLEGMREIRRVLVEEGVLGVTAAFQLLVALAVMAFYSWLVALLFLAVMPAYGLLMRYSSRRLKPAFDSLEEAFGRYQCKQLDSIRGIEVVKVTGAEEGLRRTLLREFEGLQDRLYRRDVTLLVYDGLVSLATLGIVALFLWVGALLVYAGQLSIGGLVAVNALVLLANAPLRILLALWDQLLEYDGVDLRDLDLRVVRSRLGFVLQEPFLFDATIAEDIAFGHEQIDLARSAAAAAIANAAEFIERLPLGYQTRVGDSGLKLSTGQAQRISIARAVYDQPSVLLMDEPTSALDPEAERAVKEGVGRTVICAGVPAKMGSRGPRHGEFSGCRSAGAAPLSGGYTTWSGKARSTAAVRLETCSLS